MKKAIIHIPSGFIDQEDLEFELKYRKDCLESPYSMRRNMGKTTTECNKRTSIYNVSTDINIVTCVSCKESLKENIKYKKEPFWNDQRKKEWQNLVDTINEINI